jgi:hypothetical protein
MRRSIMAPWVRRVLETNRAMSAVSVHRFLRCVHQSEAPGSRRLALLGWARMAPAGAIGSSPFLAHRPVPGLGNPRARYTHPCKPWRGAAPHRSTGRLSAMRRRRPPHEAEPCGGTPCHAPRRPRTPLPAKRVGSLAPLARPRRASTASLVVVVLDSPPAFRHTALARHLGAGGGQLGPHPPDARETIHA